MKQITKLVQVVAVLLFVSLAAADPTNSTWNYDNNGSDWGDDYSKCTAPYTVESPVNFHFDWAGFVAGTNYFLHDWSDAQFSFLPASTAATVKTYGFENWVYQMSDFSDEIAGFYGSEPLASNQNHQIYWKIDNIRYHHPAEHKINGTTYDLEMQIFGDDFYGRHAICSGQGAVSILFTIDDTTSGSEFFTDWQSAATAGEAVTIDLNKVLPKTTGATNIIYGYSGTDTMPGCGAVCWYVVESPQTITTAQRDFFIYESNASNARTTGLGND